jgi:nudix-type nucleoside diphosphatase (YffH/AdpP family)
MSHRAEPEHRARIGIDRPDGRGRTGLDQVGRELAGNPAVIVRNVEVTSDGWHVLRRTTFDYRRRDGRWETQQRETYDRGNGATILLYDTDRRTVLLTRQFRFPAYVNNHPDGMLIEAAAGLLDDQDAETAIRRETREELGVTIGELHHIYDVYMSPGSVTECVHFYAAPYVLAARTETGGGDADEGEDIEVLELPYDQALAMIRNGQICDGKTIMLLYWAAVHGPFGGTGDRQSGIASRRQRVS